MDSYEPEYEQMMTYGQQLVQGKENDVQYMFLRERLQALEFGWKEMHQMWENRQDLLSQGLRLQIFLRDAKQAEVLLNQQENFLSREEIPVIIFLFYFHWERELGLFEKIFTLN